MEFNVDRFLLVEIDSVSEESESEVLDRGLIIIVFRRGVVDCGLVDENVGLESTDKRFRTYDHNTSMDVNTNSRRFTCCLIGIARFSSDCCRTRTKLRRESPVILVRPPKYALGAFIVPNFFDKSSKPNRYLKHAFSPMKDDESYWFLLFVGKFDCSTVFR